MEPKELTDPKDLEAALDGGTFLLFKHSQICPISARAFREYRTFLEDHPDTPTAWVDVIEQRPLSQELARRTGVKHESPQALLVQDGSVAWHASHGAITHDGLAAAVSDQAEPSGS